MKKITTLLFILLCIINLKAQLNHQWSFVIQGSGIDQINDIAINTTGEVYVIGSFSGSMDFDPGTGFNYESPSGTQDIFIAKFSNTGSFIWVKRMGSSNYCNGYAIELDQNDNIYIAGTFTGTVDFDPNVGVSNLVNPSSNKNAGFFAKYDSNGTFQWAKAIMSASENVYCHSLFLTGTNIYISGGASGNVDFDPSTSTANQNLTPQSTTSTLPYFAKYDLSGNYSWAKYLDGQNGETYDLYVNSLNQVFITGWFSGLIDMDPSSGTANYNSGGTRKAFVGRYDSSGNIDWSNQIGAVNYNNGRAIIADNTGNVYLTGMEDSKIHLSKYNSSGNLQWVNKIGYNVIQLGFLGGTDIEIDSNGDLLINGFVTQSPPNSMVDFDPSTNTVYAPYGNGNSFSYDVFVANYSSNDGSLNWVDAVGGVMSPESTNNWPLRAMKLHTDGSIFLAGSYEGDIHMNPGSSPIYTALSPGFKDSYLAKYNVTGVGIDEQSTNFEIEIYPNPTNSTINITLEEAANIKVTIRNSLGQSIMQDAFKNSTTVRLDLDIPAGLYFLEIEANGNKVTKKLIKQ